MPDKWMTVAEAATALKVHPRTIERRIAGGKVQARRAEDGTLQVMINLPDAPPEQAPDSGALETVRELAADQVTLATGSASAIVRFAQNDATRAREELSIVRQDVGRARKSALAAWCVVAAVGIGVCVAVGWTAAKFTKANEDVRQLTERANLTRLESDKLKAQVEQEKQQLAAERDAARQEAIRAKLEGAEATGKLAVYIEQSAKRPTTKPTNRIQRALAALSEPD